MIAVTFALPDESRVFIQSLHGLRTISAGSLPLYFGKLDGLEIAVLHTGVGEGSARDRVTGFLSRYLPELVISSGFAGALDPGLPIASLVIASNFSSPVLLDSARRFFQGRPDVLFGGLTTQMIPAESVSSKRSLASATGALAVDMETAALAASCGSIPFLSLRAISDTALQPLPLPFSVWFDPVAQRANVPSLLLYLAAHPGVIPDFIRFVRGVFRAKKSLALNLKNLIAHLRQTGICSQT